MITESRLHVISYYPALLACTPSVYYKLNYALFPLQQPFYFERPVMVVCMFERFVCFVNTTIIKVGHLLKDEKREGFSF